MGGNRRTAERRTHHGPELEPGGPGVAEDAGKPDLYQGQAMMESKSANYQKSGRDGQERTETDKHFLCYAMIAKV